MLDFMIKLLVLFGLTVQAFGHGYNPAQMIFVSSSANRYGRSSYGQGGGWGSSPSVGTGWGSSGGPSVEVGPSKGTISYSNGPSPVQPGGYGNIGFTGPSSVGPSKPIPSGGQGYSQPLVIQTLPEPTITYSSGPKGHGGFPASQPVPAPSAYGSGPATSGSYAVPVVSMPLQPTPSAYGSSLGGSPSYGATQGPKSYGKRNPVIMIITTSYAHQPARGSVNPSTYGNLAPVSYGPTNSGSLGGGPYGLQSYDRQPKSEPSLGSYGPQVSPTLPTESYGGTKPALEPYSSPSKPIGPAVAPIKEPASLGWSAPSGNPQGNPSSLSPVKNNPSIFAAPSYGSPSTSLLKNPVDSYSAPQPSQGAPFPQISGSYDSAPVYPSVEEKPISAPLGPSDIGAASYGGPSGSKGKPETSGYGPSGPSAVGSAPASFDKQPEIPNSYSSGISGSSVDTGTLPGSNSYGPNNPISTFSNGPKGGSQTDNYGAPSYDIDDYDIPSKGSPCGSGCSQSPSGPSNLGGGYSSPSGASTYSSANGPTSTFGQQPINPAPHNSGNQPLKAPSSGSFGTPGSSGGQGYGANGGYTNSGSGWSS